MIGIYRYQIISQIISRPSSSFVYAGLMRRVILSLFICLFTFPSTVNALVIEGKVVHVADGDTITVLDPNKDQHRVRLAGIDAPE